MKIKKITLTLLILAGLTGQTALHAKRRAKKSPLVMKQVLPHNKQLLGTKSIEQFLDYATPSEVMQSRMRMYFSNLPGITGRSVSESNNQTFFDHSMKRYITKQYNKQNYANVLSQDSAHLEQFLSIATQHNFDTESVYTWVRLFNNKLTFCEVIDYTVVDHTLATFDTKLAPWFAQTQLAQPDVADLSKQIELLMLDSFTSHLSDFKQKPDQFISKLADAINTHAQKKLSAGEEHEEAQLLNRFRNAIKQTIEKNLSKMVWNPYAPESIKPSFISMGNHLVSMAEKKIINHMDDLDDLLASLNARLVYFLDLYGSTLEPAWYDEFSSDLDQGTIFFLELAEQDAYVTPKKTLLARKLINARTRSVARTRYGIQSDQLV